MTMRRFAPRHYVLAIATIIFLIEVWLLRRYGPVGFDARHRWQMLMLLAPWLVVAGGISVEMWKHASRLTAGWKRNVKLTMAVLWTTWVTIVSGTIVWWTIR
jgi:hypothetical protein